MDVLKNSLFPKIDFKRDIIPAKIWFAFGKRKEAKKKKIKPDLRLENGKH